MTELSTSNNTPKQRNVIALAFWGLVGSLATSMAIGVLPTEVTAQSNSSINSGVNLSTPQKQNAPVPIPAKSNKAPNLADPSAGAVVFDDKKKIAASNEHVLYCLSDNLVGRPNFLTIKNSEGKFETTEYKYTICLKRDSMTDITFAFNDLQSFVTFLNERVKNAKTTKDFFTEIFSGATITVRTFKNAGDGYSDQARNVVLYPSMSQIQGDKDGGKGILAFDLYGDMVAGTSGSPGMLNNNPEFTLLHFAGFKNEGRLDSPKNKEKLYHFDKDTRTYYFVDNPSNYEKGAANKPNTGYLTLDKLAEIEYLKVQEKHPKLKGISYSKFKEKGNVAILAPLTQYLYKNIRDNGIVKLHLNSLNDLSQQQPQGN